MQLQSFNEIWSLVLDEMKKEFSETTLNLWFSELELSSLTDTTAVFSCTSAYKRDILEKRYGAVIASYLKNILGFSVAITIETNPVKEKKTPEPVRDLFSYYSAKPEEQEEPPFYSIGGNNTDSIPAAYNNEYTFDNFIVGSSNKFAYAACIAVANNPATAYNPLFIYGPSGLGKTHLLYAITNEISKHTPSVNLLYVKGEEFTNQLIDSISTKTTVLFREKYRNVDVLLIDDIQFIAGKDTTQEEFFHTFNALYEEHKQIILTSDRPPRDIKTLEDRLKSRFECGLIVDIQPPDLELRIAILKKKAVSMGVDIPNEVLGYLADNLKNNIRQIEGAIKKMGAYSFLNGIPIEMQLARTVIADVTVNGESANVTIDRILEKVSQKYGVTPTDLRGRKRNRELSMARHVGIYLTRTLTELSLPAIGKVFMRDHTTILASIDTVEREMRENSIFEMELYELMKEIKG